MTVKLLLFSSLCQFSIPDYLVGTLPVSLSLSFLFSVITECSRVFSVLRSHVELSFSGFHSLGIIFLSHGKERETEGKGGHGRDDLSLLFCLDLKGKQGRLGSLLSFPPLLSVYCVHLVLPVLSQSLPAVISLSRRFSSSHFVRSSPLLTHWSRMIWR